MGLTHEMWMDGASGLVQTGLSDSLLPNSLEPKSSKNPHTFLLPWRRSQGARFRGGPLSGAFWWSCGALVPRRRRSRHTRRKQSRRGRKAFQGARRSAVALALPTTVATPRRFVEWRPAGQPQRVAEPKPAAGADVGKAAANAIAPRSIIRPRPASFEGPVVGHEKADAQKLLYL